MNLFSVHCGYYDRETGDGVYESHINVFVAAENFADAKKKAKALPQFIAKKMHVDGIQQISGVDGYKVVMEKTDSPEASVKSICYDDIKNLGNEPVAAN